MKKTTLIWILTLFSTFASAQTVLGPGDIAFVGIGTDGITNADDAIAFVLLKDIDAATEIIFTDRGWNDGSGFFEAVGDGDFTWSSGVARSAGEIVELDLSNLQPLAASFTTLGDQLFAIQGSIASPTFIAGLHFNDTPTSDDANWDGAATDNQTSGLPDALETGVNAIRLVPEADNWQYSCSSGACPVTGTPAEILAALNNVANWASDDASLFPTTVDPALSISVIDASFAPFVTTWRTDEPGNSNDDQITISTFPGETYNYTVDWGDGTTSSGVTGDITHTYAIAGTYTVSIRGVFPRFYAAAIDSDKLKLLSVNQWGDIAWSSMEDAFNGCAALDMVATDVPDLSSATILSRMFAGCTVLVGNSSFNSWDVSNITEMNAMFTATESFNQDLGNWNVTNVTQMSGMFFFSTGFNNGSIDNWDVSGVKAMNQMFQNATAFNQDLNNWNTGNVTDFQKMFEGATSFNGDISSWDTSGAFFMHEMFKDAPDFDQDISGWDVSKVATMFNMFDGATSFDQDLSTWDIGSIFQSDPTFSGMTGMFANAGLSRMNYDATLIGWATLDAGETQIPADVVFDGGNSEYCLSETQRQTLIDTYNWTITDAGLNCPDTAAPFIVLLDPADDAVAVATDANLAITFNEPIRFGTGLIEIRKSSDGSLFESYDVTGAAELFINGTNDGIIIDPAMQFQPGTGYYVTIAAGAIEDFAGNTFAGISDNSTYNFTTVSPPVTLIITEIMYNPASAEDNWEWVEVYNAGSSDLDLSGFVIDDANGSFHTVANIASGIVPAGGSAVLFNADDITAADFEAAWGTINLIPVTNWGVMALNNGGDVVAIWENLADYTGDENTYANVVDIVQYDGSGIGWPLDDGIASIFLTDLTADNAVGSNWALSTDGATTPVFDAYTSLAAGGNVGGEIASPGTPPAPPVPELLLSEIVVTPTGGEFIEIYNPGSTTIDLSNIYISDATFAGGNVFYYNIVTGANAGGGNFSDFTARFPDGASIAAGEYQTIALSGSDAFATEYGFPPTYELYEDGASADAIPDMREGLPGTINSQGGLTNSGEFVILFYWDGQSDLVTDLDYVVWGDKAEAVDKSGVSVDGPDSDSDASTYLGDTAISSQQVVSGGGHSFGNSFQRGDLTEGNETKTGGNGASGHDETSEDLGNSWCSDSAATPGAANVCSTPVDITLISAVQGNGPASPLAGNLVTIEGIVTGDFQDGDADASRNLRGFYVQEEDGDADGDPMTSEGIFVFEDGDTTTDVSAGDKVQVTGTVEEFFGETQLGMISSIVITEAGAGGVTPTALSLPVTQTTTNSLGQTIPDLEPYEGMWVTFAQNLTVQEYFNYDRFGEIRLIEGDRPYQFTQLNAPDGAGFAAQEMSLVKRSIILDDGLSIQNPDPLIFPAPGFSDTNGFRGGDAVSGLSGNVRFSRGSGSSGTETYRIEPVSAPVFSSQNPRQGVPGSVGGSLKVASLNTLNFFATIDSPGASTAIGGDPRGADSSAELDRQTEKLVRAVMDLDADILGLVELENDFLAGSGGNAIERLVDFLNMATGPGTYDWVDPGTQFVGDDVIAVGIIYKTARVSLAGTPAILDTPAFLDPNNSGQTRNRAVLAQSFEETATGEVFTLAVNHFKSKGQSGVGATVDADQGDGQGPWNDTRTKAAIALADWLGTDPTASGDPDFMIVGDLNAYAEEDPIKALEDAGFTDVSELFVGSAGYNFLFDGQLGTLDYIMVNAPLLGQVTGATNWHINADEPDALDYNLDFGRNPALFNGGNPYRAADHDPVLVGLGLDTEPTVLSALEFRLVDADNDVELFVITDGMDINKNDLPTDQLNIVAVTTDDVESVFLNLTGAKNETRTENFAPYALFGDSAGNFAGMELPLGAYNLAATPYSGNNASGDTGTQLSISFNLIEGDPGPDLTPPIITLLGANPQQIIQGEAYVELGATATDNVDGDISGAIVIDASAVNTGMLGSYQVTYNVVDAAGNAAIERIRTVQVVEENSPAGPLQVLDARDDTFLFNLTDGLVIYKSEVGDIPLGVIFNTDLNPGGVSFSLSGPLTENRFEGPEPHSLFGDIGVDIQGKVFPLGDYTLVATPNNGPQVTVNFSVVDRDPACPIVTLDPFAPVLDSDAPFPLTGGSPAGGTYSGLGVSAGSFNPAIGPGTYMITYTVTQGGCTESATATIEVRSATALQITNFWLVDADADVDILEITPGMEIDLSTLPTANLNLRAEASSDTESVQLQLTGPVANSRTENFAPYALFGDNSGNYAGQVLPAGAYNLSAQAFAANGASGASGPEKAVAFTLVSGAATAARQGIPEMSLSPNSASIEVEMLFGAPVVLQQVQVFDMSGRLVYTGRINSPLASDTHVMPVTTLPDGVYMLQVMDNRGVQYGDKLIVQRR